MEHRAHLLRTAGKGVCACCKTGNFIVVQSDEECFFLPWRKSRGAISFHLWGHRYSQSPIRWVNFTLVAATAEVAHGGRDGPVRVYVLEPTNTACSFFLYNSGWLKREMCSTIKGKQNKRLERCASMKSSLIHAKQWAVVMIRMDYAVAYYCTVDGNNAQLLIVSSDAVWLEIIFYYSMKCIWNCFQKDRRKKIHKT